MMRASFLPRLTRSFCATASLALLVALAACGGGHASPVSPASRGAVAAPKDARAPGGIVAAVDGAIREGWTKAGVVPAPRADDATFIRRVTLDVIGTIPTADEVTAFVASTAPDKRERLVESLLATPAYAEHWMSYWDDVLMGHETKGQLVDRVAFRTWLRGRFEASAPWDGIVSDLVAATGRNSTGGPKMKLPQAMAMSTADGDVAGDGDRDADADDAATINGAVNWTLRFEQTPQDLAGTASRVFLGVQIQCAQCHDHKTEKWKQEDFRRFSAAFLHAKVDPLEARQKATIRRVALVDTAKIPPRFTKMADLAPIARAKATTLDGTDVDKGALTRKALAGWMTDRHNPWFARAFVNRMWGHFLGRGFYDPVDDMRESNAPSMPEVLDRLAADFAAQSFDIKALIRTLCATEAYSLAAGASARPGPENKLWARFHLVPLGPEELLRSLLRATDLEGAAEKAGIANMEQLRAQLYRQYAFLFETDEVDDVPDYSGTVTQALTLLNGQLVGQGARGIPGSALATILAQPGDDASKLTALTMRVLSRKPTVEELARWTDYVHSAQKAPPRAVAAAKRGGGPLARLGTSKRDRDTTDPRRAAYEDVMWSLLNSSEFSFNH